MAEVPAQIPAIIPQNTTTLIITGIFFLLFVVWIFWLCYWILGKFGLWKWATYRRLKKKFKNLEFREDAIEWCNQAIDKKWRFKDVRRFVKYEPAGSELLYTFLVLTKLKKKEPHIDEKNYHSNKPEEEVRRTFFKSSKGKDYYG
jgi:hypothetical protein